MKSRRILTFICVNLQLMVQNELFEMRSAYRFYQRTSGTGDFVRDIMLAVLVRNLLTN